MGAKVPNLDAEWEVISKIFAFMPDGSDMKD